MSKVVKKPYEEKPFSALSHEERNALYGWWRDNCPYLEKKKDADGQLYIGLSDWGRSELLNWWRDNTVYAADEKLDLFSESFSGDKAFLYEPNDPESLSWLDEARLQDVVDALKFHAEVIPRDGYDDEADIAFRARRKDLLGANFGKLTAHTPEPVRCLVDGLIPLNSVTMFSGAYGTLKSMVAASLAVAIAHNRTWLGRKVDTWWLSEEHEGPNRIAYVDYENGYDELSRRLAMLGDDGRVGRVCHPPFKIDDDRFWSELAKLHVRFVVIDGLSSGNPDVDEKDSRFARPLQLAERFAAKHKCTFLFLSHPPKDTEGGNVVRGTNASPGNVDALWYFKRRGDERIEITCDKFRRGRKPAGLSLGMTDDDRLVCFDSPAKPKPKDVPFDEQVLEAFRAPGATTESVAEALKRSDASVTEARKRLEAAKRLRCEGKGRATKYTVLD